MNRVSLAELIGPSVPRCPLNATILNNLDCGAYVRQTVEYAVEEGERVKSFVLLPKNVSGQQRLYLLIISMPGNLISARARSSVSPAIRIKLMVWSSLNA